MSIFNRNIQEPSFKSIFPKPELVKGFVAKVKHKIGNEGEPLEWTYLSNSSTSGSSSAGGSYTHETEADAVRAIRTAFDRFFICAGMQSMFIFEIKKVENFAPKNQVCDDWREIDE